MKVVIGLTLEIPHESCTDDLEKLVESLKSDCAQDRLGLRDMHLCRFITEITARMPREEDGTMFDDTDYVSVLAFDAAYADGKE